MKESSRSKHPSLHQIPNSNERNLNHLPQQQNVFVVLYAPSMNVPVMPRKEEYVSDRVQLPRERLVVKKDVPIRYRKEEFVSDMVQRLRLANMKDVPTMPSEEEYVVGMVPKGKITSADMKDAQIKLSKEEYVSGTVPKERLAVTKDALTMQRKEEFAIYMMQKLRPRLAVRKEDVPTLLLEEEFV